MQVSQNFLNLKFKTPNIKLSSKVSQQSVWQYWHWLKNLSQVKMGEQNSNRLQSTTRTNSWLV